MKKSSPDLFELFGSDTEFSAWEERIKQGELPTRDQLKVMLLAHPDQVLPEWLLDVVILGIDGRLKGTRGRRTKTSFDAIKWALAKAKYEKTLLWLQRREKSFGLQGWRRPRYRFRRYPDRLRAARNRHPDWRTVTGWR